MFPPMLVVRDSQVSTATLYVTTDTRIEGERCRSPMWPAPSG